MKVQCTLAEYDVHVILISDLSSVPVWDFIEHVRVKWWTEGTIRHVVCE